MAHIGEALLQFCKGNTEGRTLIVETHFARRARKLALSSLQRELVVGSLLGDAYLMPTTAGFCFRVNHGLHQRTYVDWKYAQLVEFVRTAPREVGRCYYFRTVTHPEFSSLRAEFYGESNKKTVPQGLLWNDLGAFGLAIWFMDDGASEGRQFRLNTQSFSFEDNIALAEFLRAKFGIIARLNRDKDRFRLRISSAAADEFKALVEPHLMTDMLYKVSPVTTSRTLREMEVTVPYGTNPRPS